jgi:hypothetical protein
MKVCPELANETTYQYECPGRWTPLQCLVDTPVSKTQHGRSQLTQLALELLSRMNLTAIFNTTYKGGHTFLHQLVSRGHENGLQQVLSKLWQILGLHEYHKFVNIQNNNYFGAVDAALKSKVSIAMTLKTNGATEQTPDPKQSNRSSSKYAAANESRDGVTGWRYNDKPPPTKTGAESGYLRKRR